MRQETPLDGSGKAALRGGFLVLNVGCLSILQEFYDPVFMSFIRPTLHLRFISMAIYAMGNLQRFQSNSSLYDRMLDNPLGVFP